MGGGGVEDFMYQDRLEQAEWSREPGRVFKHSRELSGDVLLNSLWLIRSLYRNTWPSFSAFELLVESNTSFLWIQKLSFRCIYARIEPEFEDVPEKKAQTDTSTEQYSHSDAILSGYVLQ